MPTLRNVKRVAGALHDVTRLQGLSSEVCHVLVVSERTLSILNNMSENELTYFSRYADVFGPEGYYEPVSADSPNADFVLDVVKNAKVELIPMTCDITAVLASLAAAINDLSATGGGCVNCPEGVTGTISDPGTVGGQPGEPAPEGYTDDPFTLDDKCAMANWYYQQTIVVFDELDNYNILGWLALGVGLAVGQLVAILTAVVSGAFWTVMTAQFGVIVSLIEDMKDLPDTSLRNIVTALEADQPGFVCALYQSSDVGNAAEELSDWAQAAGLTAAENLLLSAVLNHYVLNGLFYWSEAQLTEALAGTGYYDCGNCAALGFEQLILTVGTGDILYNGDEFTLTSEPVSTYHQINITSNCGGGTTPPGGNWCAHFTGYTLDDTTTTWQRAFYAWRADCVLEEKNYQWDSPSFAPLSTPIVFGAAQWNNPTPFSVTLKINAHTRYLTPGETPASHPITCP